MKNQHNVKKLIAIIFTAFSLGACGAGEKQNQSNDSSKESVEQSDTELRQQIKERLSLPGINALSNGVLLGDTVASLLKKEAA